MRRKSVLITVLFLTLVLSSSVLIVTPVLAGAGDNGCAYINMNANGINYSNGSYAGFHGQFDWHKGDTITWTLKAGPSSGSEVKASVDIGMSSVYKVEHYTSTPGHSVEFKDYYTFTENHSATWIDMYAYDPTGMGLRSAVIGCVPAGEEITGFGAAAIAAPPDHRENWHHGDETAVIYREEDSNGDPSLKVYCAMDNSTGVFGMDISADDLAGGSGLGSAVAASSAGTQRW